LVQVGHIRFFNMLSNWDMRSSGILRSVEW